MARKTREEKTIEHAQQIIDDLKNLYSIDTLIYSEYNKLFEEYKRLNKRFNKTLSMNDSLGKSVIIDNENLKENVDYTVKVARKKILYNIEEHRKTKETLAKHSEVDNQVIKKLRNEIKELNEYTQKLEKKLNINDGVEHEFYEDINIGINQKEINTPELSKYTYEKLLDKHILSAKKKNEPLTVIKLTIDEFSVKQKLLKDKNGDKKSVLRSLYRFFDTNIGSKNIVYFNSDDTFYIFLINRNLNDSKAIVNKINIPRQVYNVNLTFSFGVSSYDLNDDTNESFDKRLDSANKKASKENMKSSVEYK